MSKNIFLTQSESINQEYFHDEQSTISRVNIDNNSTENWDYWLETRGHNINPQLGTELNSNNNEGGAGKN